MSWRKTRKVQTSSSRRSENSRAQRKWLFIQRTQRQVRRHAIDDKKYRSAGVLVVALTLRRTRQRPNWETKLASALLALGKIPYDDAKAMGRTNFLSLWQYHHNIRHANEGSDEFWNLEPLLIAAHNFKTFKNNGTGRSDATDMAHDRALIKRQHQHGERIAAKLYGESKPEPERRARKLTGRGFGKGHRPMRGRNGFQGRQP